MATTQKLSTAELLFGRALRMGLAPRWLARDSLFAISTSAGERYVHYANSDMNSQLSSSLTRNKLNTRLVLDQHGLPNIAYLNAATLAEAEAFLATHKKIIVKPLTGSNSHDVSIVESPEQLAGRDIRQYILEKYIAGKEVRYLVLDGNIIGVHESKYGESVSETRSLERISHPAAEWSPELMSLSLKTATIMGLRYAAVDYLIGPAGEVHILEVNSSPGMKWFHAPTTGPVVDVARLFLQTMLDDLALESPLVSDTLQAHPAVVYS
jgi:glutathione synthase/RimK-type ligase-like ATP-grasp enzyme